MILEGIDPPTSEVLLAYGLGKLQFAQQGHQSNDQPWSQPKPWNSGSDKKALRKNRTIQSNEPHGGTVEQIKKRPALLGGVDLLKTLQLLPAYNQAVRAKAGSMSEENVHI